MKVGSVKENLDKWNFAAVKNCSEQKTWSSKPAAGAGDVCRGHSKTKDLHVHKTQIIQNVQVKMGS